MSLYTRVCSGLLFPLHERLKGHDSVRMRRELERTQWHDAARLRDEQLLLLRSFLKDIGAAVPYYRDTFAKHGFDPASIASTADLARLPFLTKALIRDNVEALKAADAGPLIRYNTGGSSGQALVFYMGKGRVSHDVAAKWRATRWWGVDIGDPEIVLWGSPIELGRQDRMRAIRDSAFRTRLLPAFEMSEAAMDGYIDVIRRVRPRMLFGYASALALLATHAQRRGAALDDLGIKVAFATGETLYPNQQQVINATFGAPVANGYGARDAGFIAHACPAGSLHLSTEHVVVELVNDAGQCVADGESGEIVITHLATRDFPFVRYRTGDVAVMATKPCSCGRGLPAFEQVLGRTTDFIRTRAGNVMHALALIYEVRSETSVLEFRFLQARDLSIDLQLVATGELSAQRERDIIARLARRLGADTPIKISRVERIPPAKSGKHRYVVSEAQ